MSPVVKKKPERQKLPSKYVLLIYTFITFLLMAITFTGAIPDSFIRNAFGAVIVPFERGIASVSMMLTDAATKKATIEVLNAENMDLKKKIEELQEENTLLLQDKYELTSLRDLYELDSTYTDYEKVGARVISWDANNWFSSFTIDKGTRDGITVDMNVIAGGGLVGRVTEVGYNWSKVTSIIEDNCNVSAYILHTQDNLIVSGGLDMYDKGYLSFSRLVDSTGTIEVGDKVVTSYISDKYLPGILIGTVATMDNDSNHITKSGLITPVVDFTHLSEVLIITQTKEELEY